MLKDIVTSQAYHEKLYINFDANLRDFCHQNIG